MKDRTRSIGGSDIAPILGISPWRTAADVWAEKTGSAVHDVGSPQKSRGKYLESAILDNYEKNVRPLSARDVSIEREYRSGTLDAITTDRVVEAKTTQRYLLTEWGESGSQEVPPYYLTQLAWYMMLSGREVADVALCVIPTNPDLVLGASPEEIVSRSEIRKYTIPRDTEVEQAIIERVERFWTDHVIARVPPTPQSVRDLRYFPQQKAKKINGDSMRDAIESYTRLSAEASALEKEKNRLREAIMMYAGDAEIITIDGQDRLRISETTRKAYTVQESTMRTMRIIK